MIPENEANVETSFFTDICSPLQGFLNVFDNYDNAKSFTEQTKYYIFWCR
jgi:hypothetical protein